jgi:hypothetical protein
MDAMMAPRDYGEFLDADLALSFRQHMADLKLSCTTAACRLCSLRLPRVPHGHRQLHHVFTMLGDQQVSRHA